jgi:hypothetical protein
VPSVGVRESPPPVYTIIKNGLGEGTPEIGKEYEGNALLLEEAEGWKVLHWTTPLEDSATQFRQLQSPP